MVLIVIPFLIVIFFAAKYGTKSDSKAVRIFSYSGIFVLILLMALLAFALVIEKIED